MIKGIKITKIIIMIIIPKTDSSNNKFSNNTFGKNFNGCINL
jgi:hypothetical protein